MDYKNEWSNRNRNKEYKKIESILQTKFSAEGRGLHEKITSIESYLDSQQVIVLRGIATLRNKTVHEDDFEITDIEGFKKNCLEVSLYLHEFDTSSIEVSTSILTNNEQEFFKKAIPYVVIVVISLFLALETTPQYIMLYVGVGVYGKLLLDYLIKRKENPLEKKHITPQKKRIKTLSKKWDKGGYSEQNKEKVETPERKQVRAKKKRVKTLAKKWGGEATAVGAITMVESAEHLDDNYDSIPISQDENSHSDDLDQPIMEVNPATGLPMTSSGGVDVGGNPYGMDNNEIFDSNIDNSFDSIHDTSLDDSFSSSFDDDSFSSSLDDDSFSSSLDDDSFSSSLDDDSF